MSSRGTPLAALILSLGRLQASPEAARQIAGLLGLGLEPETVDEEALPSQPSVVPAPTFLADEAEEEPASQRASFAASPAEVAASVASAGKQELQLARVIQGTATVKSRPSPGALPTTTSSHAPLPLEPLLRPVVTRAVVSASLARRGRNGPVDVTRLVEAVARRKPIERIPRVPAWGVASSARVMVDCGPGMALFARDAADLSAWLHSVASRDRTTLLRFWQTPFKVGPSPKRAAPAKLPPPGTVVVALTELGIARTGSRTPELAQHWLQLDAELRASGSSLVIFVPYPEARWPAALVGKLALVRWDRRTSLADVRAARPTPRSRA